MTGLGAHRERMSGDETSVAEATDEALVREAQRGDRSSLAKLYVRHSPLVHGILLARVSVSDAEDILQEVFITALTRIDTLREPAAFVGWIARIARNRAADHRRGSVSTSDLDTDTATQATRATQAGDFEAARALEAIRNLPLAYRETLMLRLVEGMTGPEIAHRTGLTPGSVRVNLHRGMQLLREALR